MINGTFIYNDFILFDRLEVIRKTIQEYGEENFCLSLSGGKDSTVLHHLLDMAIPENRIPRVFINTGIEYVDIVKFVKALARDDDRIHIVNNRRNIRKTLDEYGYPFKSKIHSKWVDIYQRNGKNKATENYLGEGEKQLYRQCPQDLKYQFTDQCTLRISDKCCLKMKEEPFSNWQKENNKPIRIVGVMRAEGGRRMKAKCLAFKGDKLSHFQPLAVISKEWEEWFIKQYNVKLCRLYYEPFNFERTGCKGCPFTIKLQEQLETLEKYLPNERKQCEILWKPVYEEYRRLGYRLKKDEQVKLF